MVVLFQRSKTGVDVITVNSNFELEVAVLRRIMLLDVPYLALSY